MVQHWVHAGLVAKLEQVAQRPVPLGLESPQGWRCHHLPVPDPHHSCTTLAQNDFLLMPSKHFPSCRLSDLPPVLPNVSLRRVGLWFLCFPLWIAPLFALSS